MLADLKFVFNCGLGECFAMGHRSSGFEEDDIMAMIGKDGVILQPELNRLPGSDRQGRRRLATGTQLVSGVRG